MQQNLFANLSKTTLIPALIAMGLLAGCSGGGSAADASTPTGERVAGASAATSQAPANEAPVASADFEGTMQQVMIALGPDAISSLAGSSDLSAILALSPDRVIEAVHNGEVEAKTIQKSTLEIDGRMGRLQTEGQSGYTILDGKQLAAHVVDNENNMIMTMDPAKLAEATAAQGEDAAGAMELDVEQIGQREIRGFDATGHRFEFMGDNIATVWLSEELESEVGPIFDIWFNINPLGRMELGEGAPVRMVMVNRETLAEGGGFMPAYTITEFYDLQPGAIADERFDLPDGYQRRGMAELGRGAP